MTKSDKLVTEAILEEKLEEKLRDIPRMDDFRQIVQDISEINEDKWRKNDEKLDRIIGMLDNWEVENAVGAEHTRELRVQVDDHDKRLKKLEATKN